MSYVSEYLKAVKKMEEDRKKYQASKPAESRTPVSPIKNYWDKNADVKSVNINVIDNDIAPVSERISARSTINSNKKEKDKWYQGWLQKGAIEDRMTVKNVAKAILATSDDVLEDLGTGIIGMGEKTVDALSVLGTKLERAQFYQNGGAYNVKAQQAFDNAMDITEKSVGEFVAKDLYDEAVISKQIITNLNGGFDYEANSFFGEKSDSLLQSAGQMLGTAALSPVVPWWVTTGTTSFGSEAESALNSSASYDEATLSAAISAGAEILTEKLSGGIKFGGKAADDFLTQEIARGVSNKFIRNLLKFGLDASGEGLEEITSEAINNFGQWLTYRNEEELADILGSEEAMDGYIQAFLGGAALGGASNVAGAIKGNVDGVDPVSGLTKTEDAVVRKVYDTLVAEEVKRNGKVSKAKKTEIYNNVLNQLEKGYITTDTIEEVLGGESYNNYRSTVDGEDNIIKEFDELGKKEHPTLSETSRYRELEQQVKDIKSKDLRTELKSKLSNEVFSLVKDSRLAESYNEKARRSQKFEADLSKYDLQQQKTIQKAIDSGVLNNTNKTHEMVELIAKISADKNVPFDFANNAKIKESGFAIEGKIVNGYKTADGITINVDSPKYLQSTVGHEITHVLEGTELYDSLRETIFNYAISKEGLDSFNARLKAVEEMYKDIDGADFEGELVADLVGDYLFQDSDFVNNLSVENRNVFQKIFDEIKYLCKVATAGSKEARELEKVKKVFEDSYRANVNGNSFTQRQHSISHTTDNRQQITDEQNEHGLDRENEVQFSLSRDTEYMDKAIAQNDSLKFVTPKKMNDAKALRERIATRMNDIKDRGLVALPEDIEGNTYIANSSYDGTEENTTICPRSLASEAFVDAVSEYLGRPLTVEEQIYISQDLQGRSLTPECTYCYVATDRKAYRAFLGEYISQRDNVLEKVQENPNVDVSRSGELYKEFLDGRKDTNPMYSRFKMWVDAYKNGKPMVEASHLANINKLMGDINSEFGADLKPQIEDAMKYAQSASWAKKRVNYVAYNGHILKWKQYRINKLNSHYGLRMYSFSDFHPAFVLENMQMITDASVRGLKMLGYTKDTDFVEIFAPSGMNINVSTFGFETDGNVYENNIIGAEWDKAKALREQYPNVGITFVATNDHLVNWALEQDWIDVVIPYHLVRTGAEVAKAFGYTNYTSESSDTKTKDWAKGDKKYIAPTEHNNDKDTYFASLEKNHLNPRFERFKNNPNYMKLVNECRQPASESKPVHPVFNEDAAMVALAKLEANGYYQPIGGSVDRMYEIAAEVAEDMRNKLAPQFSLSKTGEAPIRYGSFATPATELRLEGAYNQDVAPVTETVTENAPVAEDETVEDVAPAEKTTVNEPRKNITRKALQEDIVIEIKSTFMKKGFDFDKVLKNAKNLSTFATVDNTPQRVMEKALGYKEGNVLADITVNKVAQNESEGIKWLNSFTDRKNGLLAQLSKQYNIKPGSKESAAAQMYAEGFYVNANNDIIQYGDNELAADFKNEKVRENIKRLARDQRIRKVYDETLTRINESRTRNAYPEIPRLDNYFLHFRAMEDTFSRLGLPFNPNDIRAKDLPTDLNGVTADLKPGQPYFASAMHREGKRTSFDLLGGLEKYLTSAKNQIYHIDDIQTLRALRNYIADTYGQANGLEDLDSLSELEAEERIKQVYGSHLSTFAKFLNEEANVLAGKTALIDRGLEGVIGRRGITFLNTVNQQVGANMVGWNISSSLTNFLPVAQTFAKTNKFDFVKAFAQTVANKVGSVVGKTDGFADNSPVVIRRKGADRFYRTPWQKLSDPGYAFMSAVDDISTELIARTKYNELTRKGMDSQQAHYETDKWVSRLMGDRSLGQMPQLYNSKMLGLVTKFQLEVRNQLDSQFYDTIQETKASNEDIKNGLLRNAKTAAKVTSTFVQLAVVQHLFGKAFESVSGYNPAFDIIEVLMTAFGFDDEEESEDTVLDNIEQGFFALLEDLPYASTFTGGGRIPISSALPIKELVKGEDQYGNEKSRWETLGEIAPYYALPGGYGQIKKTVQGLGMFSDEHPIAGSYTDSGNLRFTVEDNLKNKLKAAIFGQYASENARKYFDEQQKPLTPEQAKILAAMDIPVEEYWEYKENLDAFYDKKDNAKEAANKDNATTEDILKSRYISSVSSEISNLTEKQKELVNGNSQNNQAQIKDIQNQIVSLLDDANGALENVSLRGNYAEIGNRRYNYDANKDTWYEIKPKTSGGSTNKYYEKEQKVTKSLNISYEEYWNNKEEYDFAYENPAKYSLAKAVGGYDAYNNYTAYLSTLKADKDAYGNSIDGTKKAKVYDYIFNQLDAEYGEKIILYRSMYSSKADKNAYNYDIVMYLLGRDDISYKEMETILNSLDIQIDSDFNFTW